MQLAGNENVQAVPIDDMVDTTADIQADGIPVETVPAAATVDEELAITIYNDSNVPDGSNMEGANRPVIVREEGMSHKNAQIHHGLDLWQRIKEYDQRSQEQPFVPVLSKKTEANVAKTSV